MEPTSKYTTGHIFIAVLGGTVAGAIAALLWAPKSGPETRQQIAGYYHDAKGTFSRVPEAIKSASHAGKEALQSQSGNNT